jgi:hypothetical protein
MLDPMLCPPELSHSATFKQPSWILNTATKNVGPLQQRPCREPSEAVAHRVLMSKATGCTRRAVPQIVVEVALLFWDAGHPSLQKRSSGALRIQLPFKSKHRVDGHTPAAASCAVCTERLAGVDEAETLCPICTAVGLRCCLFLRMQDSAL